MRPLLVGIAAAVLLSGCGGDRPAANPSAQPFSARSTAPSAAPRVTAADFRRPLAAYRRYVARRLTVMLADVQGVRTAAARGDLAAARAAWLRAAADYQSIGAAYGAFGALDRAIDGGPQGLPGGVRSRRFTGLHRVELALWPRRSTRDARAPADKLERDVRRLRTRIPRAAIDPLDYARRAHEVLEDALHLQLAGAIDQWSGSALSALRADLAGTRVVLHTLRPLIARRDTTGRLAQSERGLDRIARAIRFLERSDGGLPRWDRVDQRARERIAGLTAGTAEQLAYVPEIVDPRPPRPAQLASR